MDLGIAKIILMDIPLWHPSKSLMLAFGSIPPGICGSTATISATEYQAGDIVTIEGAIDPGQELYIAISSQKTFAPQDTKGVHETKRLNKDSKQKGFANDTAIPALYYMLTTNPEKFGKVTKKKFGGPSFFTQKGKRGLYETTMFKLSKFDGLDAEAKSMLTTIKTAQEWNFYKYAHESGYGINTIVKEKTKVGKVTIFARSVLGDYNTTKNYLVSGTVTANDA